MELTGTIAISASALTAERRRLDVIASNLANANTTRTEEGGPYRRRNVVFVTKTFEENLGATIDALADRGARAGVRVAEVIEDQTPLRRAFEPGHPDADAEGYVSYPNVNPVNEMVDLMAATRAYEANVQAVKATRRMGEAAMGIAG